MNEQPMVPKKSSSSWWWIILIVVVLIGAGYIISTNLPTKIDKVNQTDTPLTDIDLKNVTFYPIKFGGPYTDQEADMFQGSSTCMFAEVENQTIKVTYQGKEGSAIIVKGTSPGCPPTMVVEQGTFIPN